MPNRNKNKGKAGEREVCKIFASVFGGSWQRTFTSGAFTGGSNSGRAKELSESQLLNNSNDIVPPDEYPRCALEVKTRKDFNFHHLFRKEGVLELNEWIEQVRESGIDMERSFPLVAFKPNRMGWFIMVWGSKISDITLGEQSFSYYKYGDEWFAIFDMEDFLINNKDYLIKKFS